MDIVTWVTLVIAVAGWIFAFIGWLFNNRRYNKEVKKAEKQRIEDKELAKKQRIEDHAQAEALWKKQEEFNRSLAPLNVEVQLNQIENPNGVAEFKEIMIRDASGEVLFSGKTDFLKFFVNSGWLSRIYIIDACFKDEKNPYVDMTKYYNNAQNFGKHLKKHSAAESLIWIEEENNRIRLFCNNVMNFYPELDPSIFFQYYLVEGSDKRCQLFMYGLDNVHGTILPFVMDRKGIASTVNTVNPTFRQEYLKLENHLINFGYEIV